MLRLAHLEQLQMCLGALPAIVDSQKRRLYSFPEEVQEWLRQTEEDMENAQLYSVSEIAALRSRLLLALHRSDEPSRPGATSRKHREAVASSVLQEAQRVVTQAIEPKVTQLQEAETIAMSVASVARVKSIIDQARDAGSHQAALQYIQSAMTQDSDTAAAMVHLVGIMGVIDALIVLDRAIPELNDG